MTNPVDAFSIAVSQRAVLRSAFPSSQLLRNVYTLCGIVGGGGGGESTSPFAYVAHSGRFRNFPRRRALDNATALIELLCIGPLENAGRRFFFLPSDERQSRH